MDLDKLFKKLIDLNRTDEVSLTKATLRKLQPYITDLCHQPLQTENDGEMHVNCMVKYIDTITSIASNRSFKEQINICKKNFWLITNILSSQMQEIFLRTATNRIFDLIIDDAQSWCIKKELLKFFISCIKNTDRCFRLNIVQALPEFYLFKLIDTVSIYGDYDFQVLLIETVIRMYGRRTIEEKLKDLIPESKELSESFASINGDTFDEDVRKFLNLLNAKVGKVFSIVCQSVFLESRMCEKPLDGVDGLWVDFNLSDKVISWYCSRSSFTSRENESDSFSESGEDKIWNMITMFEHDVESVQVRRISRNDVILILIRLSGPCLSCHDDYQEIVGAAKVIKFFVPCNEDTTDTLLNKVLPSIFKTKYCHLSGKVSTSKKVYKPMNISFSRKAKSNTARSKSDTFSSSSMTPLNSTGGSRSDKIGFRDKCGFRKIITISSVSTKSEVISIPDSSTHSTNASLDLLAVNNEGTENAQEDTEFETARMSPDIRAELKQKISLDYPSFVPEIISLNSPETSANKAMSDSDTEIVSRRDTTIQSMETKSSSTKLSSLAFLDNELCTVDEDINHIQILSGRCSGSNVRYSQKSGRSSKTTSTPRKQLDDGGKTDMGVNPNKKQQNLSSSKFETPNKSQSPSPTLIPRKLSNNGIKTDFNVTLISDSKKNKQTNGTYSQQNSVASTPRHKKSSNEIKASEVSKKEQSSSPVQFETANDCSQNSSDDSDSSMKVNIFKYKDAILTANKNVKKSHRNKSQSDISEYFKSSSKSISPDKKTSGKTSDIVFENDAVIVISEDNIKPTPDLFLPDLKKHVENDKSKELNEDLGKKCKTVSEESVVLVKITETSPVKQNIDANNKSPPKIMVTEAPCVAKNEATSLLSDQTQSNLGKKYKEASEESVVLVKITEMSPVKQNIERNDKSPPKIMVTEAPCVSKNEATSLRSDQTQSDIGKKYNEASEESVVLVKITEMSPVKQNIERNDKSPPKIMVTEAPCVSKNEATSLLSDQTQSDLGKKYKAVSEESLVLVKITETSPVKQKIETNDETPPKIMVTEAPCVSKNEATSLLSDETQKTDLNKTDVIKDKKRNRNGIIKKCKVGKKALKEETSVINKEKTTDPPSISSPRLQLQKTDKNVKTDNEMHKECEQNHEAVLNKQDFKVVSMEENESVSIESKARGAIPKRPKKSRPNKKDFDKAKTLKEVMDIQVEKFKQKRSNEENNNVSEKIHLPGKETELQSGKNEVFEKQPQVAKTANQQDKSDVNNDGIINDGDVSIERDEGGKCTLKNFVNITTRTKGETMKRRARKRGIICSSDESDKENLEMVRCSPPEVAAVEIMRELYVKLSNIECRRSQRRKQVKMPTESVTAENVESNNQGVVLTNETDKQKDSKTIVDENERNTLRVPLKTLSTENRAGIGLATDIESQKSTKSATEKQQAAKNNLVRNVRTPKNIDYIEKQDRLNEISIATEEQDIRVHGVNKEVIESLDNREEPKEDKFDVMKSTFNQNIQIIEHDNKLPNVGTAQEQKSFANQTMSTTLGEKKRPRLLYQSHDLSYWQDVMLEEDLVPVVPEFKKTENKPVAKTVEKPLKKTRQTKSNNKPSRATSRATKSGGVKKNPAKKNLDYLSVKKVVGKNPYFTLEIPKDKKNRGLKPVFEGILESFRHEVGYSLADIIEKNISKNETMSPKARKKSVRRYTKCSTKRKFEDRTVRKEHKKQPSPETSLKLRGSASEEDSTPYNSPVKAIEEVVKRGKEDKPKKINIISDIQIRPKRALLERDSEIPTKMSKPRDINVATYSQETVRLSHFMGRMGRNDEISDMTQLDRQLPIIAENITKEEINNWINSGNPQRTQFSECQCVLKHVYPMFNSLLSVAVGQEREDIKNICAILEKYAE